MFLGRFLVSYFLNYPIYVKNLQSFSLLCLRKSYLCHQNFFPEDL